MSSDRFIDLHEVFGLLGARGFLVKVGAGVDEPVVEGEVRPDVAGALAFLLAVRDVDHGKLAELLDRVPGFLLLVGMTQVVFEVGVASMGEARLWSWLRDYAADPVLVAQVERAHQLAEQGREVPPSTGIDHP